MINVHMASSTSMMAQSTSPPSSMNPRMDSSRLYRATMALLCDAGDDACGLLFQDLDQRAAAGLQDAVNHRQRNGDNQPQHRGQQRHRNTAGHHPWVTCSKQRDLLEGLDHADDGTQQAKQRRDDIQHLD